MHKAVHAAETSGLALGPLTGVGRLQWEKPTDLRSSGCVVYVRFVTSLSPAVLMRHRGPPCLLPGSSQRVSGEHRTFTSPGEQAQREGGCPRPHG